MSLPLTDDDRREMEIHIRGKFAGDARATNASSSLLGIGGWGGRCGGGNGEQPAVTNPGHRVVWFPDIITDATGHATIDVPILQASVRVALVASSSASSWGQRETDLIVQ